MPEPIASRRLSCSGAPSRTRKGRGAASGVLRSAVTAHHVPQQPEPAHKLRPFGIKPKVIRVADDATARGYAREDFGAAFGLYLTPSGGDVTDETDVTPLASTVTRVEQLRRSRAAAIASFVDETTSGDFVAAEESVRLALISQRLLDSYGDDLDNDERRRFAEMAHELVEEWSADAVRRSRRRPNGEESSMIN